MLEKRRRSSTQSQDLGPIVKKQKSTSAGRFQPRNHPPSFWNTLTKIWLTRGALKEFDLRHIPEAGPRCYTPLPSSKSLDGQARRRLKQFARHGGPDLSHLRGLGDIPLSTLDRISDHASSQVRKRSSASSRPSEHTRTTSIKSTLYSRNFEQKLIDTGIYPSRYEYLDGRLAQKPANLSEIRAAQRIPRASLSPSRFTDEDFEAFRRVNARASAETKGMYNVLPLIAGNEATHCLEMGLPLSNLKPFDKDLSDPRPDVYHGAALSTIHPRVRADLESYIIPSMVGTTCPAAPNFFFEGKSVQGREVVAKRHALIDGAIGARAMHQLQNYRADEPEYDNKARSFSVTYFAELGALQLYAHYLTKPLTPGGEPETHMTQTHAFAMTGNKDYCREGITAYRNLRDLAKTERDSSIAHANQVAFQMPAPSPNTSPTHSRTSRSRVLIAESDTSEDELVRDEVTPVKRLRPSAASSMSYDSVTGRDGRAAFEAPMAISRAPLAPPQNTMSTTRRSGWPSVEGSISKSTTHTQNGSDGSLIERRSDLSRQSQSVQGSGRGRQIRPMVEVTSERMHSIDESGWFVEHQGKSIFVADSQGPIVRRMDSRLSTALVSTSLHIGPMETGVGEGTKNFRETESLVVDVG